MMGFLAFGKMTSNAAVACFCLIDRQSFDVLFKQELYVDFALSEDRPFFHSFPGDVRSVGKIKGR